MTLGERIAVLRPMRSPSSAFDAERACEELAAWRAQPPFDRGDWWAKRLRADGLTEADLLRVLGEPAETLATSGAAPPWLLELEAAYAEPPRRVVDSLPFAEASREAARCTFLDLVEPILRRGCERLRGAALEIAARSPEMPLDARRAAELFLDTLLSPVQMLLGRTAVLELNVARVQGRLVGASPEERFAAFVETLRDRDTALALLAEYPVLARRVVEATTDWVEVTAEFLRHLAADWPQVRHMLRVPADAGRIAAIRGGAGDRHRGGRAVLVATFESGFQLVYKPHSLAVDVHFQELLAWLNERAGLLPFRTLAVLDRGDHGWSEFVATAPCADEDAVGRFYERIGALLVVLYVLEATDFHLENLIASGEHPIPIDLETLFHGHVSLPGRSTPDVDLVSRAVTQSILRSGLLPQRRLAEGSDEGVDMSGLGAREGQLSPDRVLRFAGAGTDGMRAVRERVTMPGAHNQPKLEGGEIDLLTYRGDLERGVRDAYRALVRLRDDLLAPGGPLARFANDPVRSVLRATRGYGLIQFEGKHPDLLRDALAQERFLDRVWVGLDEIPDLLSSVAAERAELLRGDIPLFTTTPSSRDVTSSAGTRIKGFWRTPGLELARGRLLALDERDLRRQLWFVRCSLATLTATQDRLLWPAYEPPVVSPIPDSAELREDALQLAIAVGDALAEHALRGPRGEVAWIAMAHSARQWNLLSLFDDLYGGYPGVIQFLAYLGHVSGHARFTELARAAYATLDARLRADSSSMTQVGAFSGLGGLVYAFAHWGTLWQDRALFDRAAEVVELLPERIERDEDFDLIGGVAGCAMALLVLDRVTPSPRHLSLARRCGDRLLEHRRPQRQGCGWLTRVQTDTPITGFSHGASGIAFALFELARVTGDSGYRSAALDALHYERLHFIEAEQNWGGVVDPRTRDPETGRAPATGQNNTLLVSWCYGAPGIGFARLRGLETVDDAVIRAEAGAALQTTLARGFGRNHCICHGDLGNLDFATQALDALPGAPGRERLEPITASILESMRRYGWLSGVPLAIESPSLMNGLAGIGLGLLRIARRNAVPCVLTLEPPRVD